jgi:CRISPR-associated protein Cmr3
MTMHYYTLTPQDAWFFRDGRPYNHGESNQADVESLFPPPARTLTGAVRAALARANGWNGSGRWTNELNRHFGSGR